MSIPSDINKVSSHLIYL